MRCVPVDVPFVELECQNTALKVSCFVEGCCPSWICSCLIPRGISAADQCRLHGDAWAMSLGRTCLWVGSGNVAIPFLYQSTTLGDSERLLLFKRIICVWSRERTTKNVNIYQHLQRGHLAGSPYTTKGAPDRTPLEGLGIIYNAFILSFTCSTLVRVSRA